MQITRAMNRILGGTFLFLGVVAAVFAPIHIYNTYAHEAAKEEALAGAPPAAVAIEDLDVERDVGPANEVVALVQIPPDSVVRAPTAETRWLAPVVATTETKPSAEPIAWLVHDSVEFSADALAGGFRGEGPAGGALVEVNGALVDPAYHFAAFEKVAGSGVQRVAVVQPFLEGREAALAPDDDAVTTALFAILAPIGALGYGLVAWRKGRRLGH